MGMETIRQDLMLYQVVIAMTMVVFSVLVSMLYPGMSPITATNSAGTVTCTATLAMSEGATAPLRLLVPPFAASGIDYLTILWVGLEVGENFFRK